VDDCLPAVLAEVRSLLDLPDGAEPPPRAVVENTLTSGYAFALSLEGEQLRIEGRLRTVLRSGGRVAADEVAELSKRLAAAERELASVRVLLSSLRAQARA